MSWTPLLISPDDLKGIEKSRKRVKETISMVSDKLYEYDKNSITIRDVTCKELGLHSWEIMVPRVNIGDRKWFSIVLPNDMYYILHSFLFPLGNRLKGKPILENFHISISGKEFPLVLDWVSEPGMYYLESPVGIRDKGRFAINYHSSNLNIEENYLAFPIIARVLLVGSRYSAYHIRDERGYDDDDTPDDGETVKLLDKSMKFRTANTLKRYRFPKIETGERID